MTSKESFEIYHKIKNLRCSDHTDYLAFQRKKDRLLEQAIANLIPEEGVGCTVVFYSDKRAATIIKVCSPTKIEVRYNKVICNDYYMGSYTILPELDDLDEKPMVFTKRKNGMWVEQGQRISGGVKLVLHFQRHYIDPHF